MNLHFENHFTLREFILENKPKFEEQLLQYAVNVREKIDEIKCIGHINLINNAHKLVLYLVDEQETEIISFAKKEGEIWAKYAMTLDFKLEWVQAIRRTLWDFLYYFDHLSKAKADRDHFYSQEKKINTLLDHFLNYFFISYSKYKDELLESQRDMVERLSVPVIPLTASISVLPLIGTVDRYRGSLLIEKALEQVSSSKTQTLIIDLSGVAFIDTDVSHFLFKVIDGITLMGCKPIITGIRPEIVKNLVSLDIPLSQKVETRATLQYALQDYLVEKE